MPFDAIEYINTPRWLTSRLGLERIRELLDRLGRPQDRLKFVHVAGTNGKGSTCAFTASILAEAGFKTGLFTSPYVETFHERIRVNGRNISDDDLTAATLRVRECAEAMEAEGGEHPTEFELMTAVALVHFAHVGCDIVVLEVGLGGRLDSTNVIAAPEVAAIVSIALDHTNLLGNTLAEIAHEKAGIVKKGSTVVSWPQEPSAMEVVEDAARRAGDKLVVPDFSLLSVGKVTRGAALLTRGTTLEHEGHTPCSDSPRFAAELRAEHAPHAQELQASSSIDAGFGGRMSRAVPHEPNVPSGTFARAQDCLSTEYAPHSQEQRETSLRKRLFQLSRLASLRHAQRERKGGIDFDQPEARVKLDEAGRPQGVELRRKNAATSLVEEMMIWANEVVAEHLSRAKFPCVYRVHEAPDLEGLAQLVPIFEEFPWFGKIDPVGFFTGSQHALQQAVSASRGRAEGELVSSLVLRSMKRAVYREKNCGHYGLASATYCHFTSPIRRYPDLMVHRMLKAELFGRPERFDQMTTNLGWICEHSSGMEREADDAQRESEELKLAEYLQRFVGQSFSAIVSGVSQGGLYARLENTAEGFIPVRTLGDDYFSFDAARYTLTGEETGARYRLGQRIAVVLFAVDPRVPQIDLRLAQGARR